MKIQNYLFWDNCNLNYVENYHFGGFTTTKMIKKDKHEKQIIKCIKIIRIKRIKKMFAYKTQKEVLEAVTHFLC